jgi:hypothetical protein
MRGYSVGQRIIDPRDGRILRGHARIESLRMREDAMIAEALLGPFIDPSPVATDTSTHTSSLTSKHSKIDTQYEGSGHVEGRKLTTESSSSSNPFHLTVVSPGAAEQRSRALQSSEQLMLVGEITEAILQRVRQLVSHEIGHTIGEYLNICIPLCVHVFWISRSYVYEVACLGTGCENSSLPGY